ncbi:hypothetical protein JL475_03605 [Streptomyces sp. M2CJ-2]|uniref:hypothetical protein n=1 Tax=Streptomyces sp. M2CJ-2 TaxID=2803948 RepID=UPI00192382F8|nr:hypothetical protein [Streptomyces sp. M2CJ-2]MBL3665118.1 hypothetical protein [Streptomyces sp. M2CJ-2]
MDRLPTTEAAVTALRALAERYEREIREIREIKVTHDVGADRASRRTAAGVGVTTDPDGSLPHEAYVEFGGLSHVRGRCFLPGHFLTVPLPGDRTHKQFIPMIVLTPRLSARVR